MGFQRAWPRRRADRPAPAEPVPTPTAVPEAPEAAEPAGLPKPPAAPSPPIAGEPADLPSGAPSIGRVGGVQLGHVKPGTTLRPAAIALDGTAAGVFQVAAASLIGAGHLQSGQPRQDAYNFMVGRSGRLYVAIADGLGSKPVSQLGAHLFTESVLVVAAHAETDGDAEPDPARLLVQASGRMADVIGDAYGLDPKTAGCVGAVAIFSDRGCAIARIGDVSAFTISGGTFTEAFPSDGGPLNIVSASMPDEDEQDLECVRLDPAAVVVFGTDGLANDIRNSGTLREWLAGQWRVPHLPFAIGDTLRYRRQGSHDDRTAVLVWRDDVEDGTGAVGHDPE